MKVSRIIIVVENISSFGVLVNFKIGDKIIGEGQPVFVIADISANHLQDFDRAKKLVKTACEVGVGAVKLQTYLPETITLKSDKEPFLVKVNDAWKNRTLYELYEEAFTPLEWHAEMAEIAKSYGVLLFSTAYDSTAVDFLEKMQVPAYKIASFEVTDLEFLKKVAQTKKPIIISRGMSTLEELTEAIGTLKDNGATDIALLHCLSSYPAKPEEMNLRTITDIAKRFSVVPGLSDHTLTTSLAVASVVLGAKVIEKHFTLRRVDGGVDAAFSLEPEEMAKLLKEVREVEKALGKVSYQLGEKEAKNKQFRRSLWVIKPIKKGEKFTKENIGSFRPASGLAPKLLPEILGEKAKQDIDFATPLSDDLIEQ